MVFFKCFLIENILNNIIFIFFIYFFDIIILKLLKMSKNIFSGCFCFSKTLLKKINFFYFFLYLKLIFFIFLNHFDTFISKIIFEK